MLKENIKVNGMEFGSVDDLLVADYKQYRKDKLGFVNSNVTYRGYKIGMITTDVDFEVQKEHIEDQIKVIDKM